MNKKRVALALAAALGINTLMVTVGQVGQQTVVAHAAGDRLVTGEDEARREALVIKHLETTAINSANGDVEVTFDNINNDLIANVEAQGFTHAKFKERETIDGTNGAVTTAWDGNTDRLKFTGIKEAGIYTGVVTITYTDNTQEKYALSLVKKASDKLELGSVNVGVGNIKVDNLTFNGKTLPANSEVYLVKKGEAVGAGSQKATLTGTSVTFGNLTNLAEGQVYEVVYKFSGDHEARAQIVLVKQAAPTVKAVGTNDPAKLANFTNDLQSQVAADFGVDAASVVVDNAANNKNTGTITLNGQNLITFNQNYQGANKPVGAILTATAVGNNLNVNLGVASTVLGEANFVPNIELHYGKDSTAANADKGLIGEYTVKIGNSPEETYFDGTSKVTSAKIASVAVGGNTVTYFEVTGLDTDLTKLNKSDFSVSLDSFSHGYSTVDVVFGVKDQDSDEVVLGGKTLGAWRNQVLGAGANVSPPDVDESLSNENAAIIVSVDKIDGVQVTSQFMKTSESTGELTLIGAGKLGNTTLTVEGATLTKLSSTGNDVKYSVTYNGEVPSTVNWSLNISDTSVVTTPVTLTGSAETGIGVVETVEFDGKVTTTNANTTNLKNQFDLVAKFDTVVPTGATLGFENQTGLRVNFDTLGTGAKTISATVNSGKNQGTYAAGIWVEDTDFVVELKSTNIATSNSITLAIEATEIEQDSLLDVKEAWLEYRLATDTTWIDDRKDKIDLAKLASEQEFRVTKTGLKPSTLYDFRVAYELKNDDKIYYSNILEDEDTLAQGSNGSGTITGGGGTTSGTSTGSTTITVSTSNSTMNGSGIDVNLPSGFKYDSGKAPVVTGIKYKDKDGKIVTEVKDQFKNVTAKFNGNKVELMELVTSKDYTEITVDYTDNNGKVRSIILKDVKLTSNVDSDKYLANIYDVVFGRPADEAGYHYHLKNLKNKNISLREFVLNMLSEKEFVEKYKTTETKIEALYSAIVNRTSDEVGKKFWVDEYKKVLAVYGSEANALRAIADRMVNEGELKTLAEKMNLKW